ncbi:MAG TPA: SEC-C metal-binding domain-containing protein, partial [Gaiellaceae bacterium]|nr:SEC-C metal-binding domain-containing protein [Gaiellaceae bacterium]
GRQGDPGESRFYLSGQDDLVRLFAGDRIHSIMERFKVPDDQPMESGLLSKQIENAQKKVEEQNFVARKNVLKYDDVLNTQREVIYRQRRQVLEGEDLSGEVKGWIREVIERTVDQSAPDEFSEDWDLEGLCTAMQTVYNTDITADELREDLSDLSRETLVDEFYEDAVEEYGEREKLWGADVAREVERYLILEVVDTRWREHLENMDYLREGVHLRAFAQKDPLVEYRAEGHSMFEELGLLIHDEVVSLLFHAQIEPRDVEDLQRDEDVNGQPMEYAHESLAGADAIAAAGAGAGIVASERGTGAVTAGTIGGGATAVATQRVVADRDKIGRNDPCWCGSGKKFKKCHGA